MTDDELEPEIAMVAVALADAAIGVYDEGGQAIPTWPSRCMTPGGEASWPLLERLGELTREDAWVGSRADAVGYIRLAEHLTEVAAKCPGRARAMLDQASVVVARLADLHRRFGYPTRISCLTTHCGWATLAAKADPSFLS